jgi:hypothetical protein
MKTPTTSKTRHADSWREYNRSLCQRGSLELWIDPTAEDLFAPPEHTGRRGHPFVYSDALIVALATLGQVFHQRLRQSVGMLGSILRLAGISKTLPHWTTLGRRRKKASIALEGRPSGARLVLLVDSTGIKVLGEGEWKARCYGLTRYRQWRKLHVSVDAETLQILAADVTDSAQRDHTVLAPMLETIASQTDVEIDSVHADGAYDKRACYDALEHHGAWPVIPPWRRAHIWKHGNSAGTPHPRDVNLRYMRQHGRSAWYCFSGYHRRSLAETTMQRLKTIFGDRVLSKSLEAQRAELLLRCRALNLMTQCGMPPAPIV